MKYAEFQHINPEEKFPYLNVPVHENDQKKKIPKFKHQRSHCLILIHVYVKCK